MTNKEWLATITANEWWLTIDWLFNVYGKNYSDSRIAILDWLEKEHKPVESGQIRKRKTLR